MRDEGWTLKDLEGELWARGVNLDQVPDAYLQSSLSYRHPEEAADFIARELNGE
jgi:hypothetical protein